MMNSEKYNRKIEMMCPTCGCTQFEVNQVNEENEVVKCSSCGREITTDDLILENSENISIHGQEIAEDIVKDAAIELQKSLKNALKGNQNIRIE